MGASGQRRTAFDISGMTCVSCQGRIERKLRAMAGVISAKADYARGTAEVVYDDRTDLGAIVSAVESLGYGAAPSAGKRGTDRNGLLGALLLVMALYVFLNGSAGSLLGGMSGFFPQAEAGMGYGMLFAVGLLTSIHCVAMCGGINLSQSLSAGSKAPRGVQGLPPASALWPAIQYNTGRVASYAAAGGAVGALGAAVSLSAAMKGAIQVVAGVLMVILGLNMLGVAGSLRAFVPRLPKSLARRIDGKKEGRGPLFVGLLNGLMPCGPLQAMQIYALGTGSALQGALSMLSFGLGTVPLMFALGAFGSLMSRKFAGRAVKAGAVLVIFMGVAMFSNGTALSGLGGLNGSGPAAASGGAVAAIPGAGGVQDITTPLGRRGYPTLTVKAGIPVRWDLYAEKGTLNGCNNAIVIPEFGIERRLQPGDNVIEFTPTRAGKFRYSCWMGMIRGTIIVEEQDAAAARPGAAEAAELEKDAEGGFPAAPGCTCCGTGPSY
ncbi:MAG: sulfite exporter TauE/SafE family protein [Synergistaceae bacterium]|jgi:sulfite exporter TauE/SafE/copper chaperone CopZ|nr:sulfite exporter TauE/SafE family protein [Synergistaceae bacterium]